jgi:halimadienyl-diphosphate synthase
VTTHATGVEPAVWDLLAGMLREPWGQTSPSVYETGRVVTLAPWLTGHADRVRWLLAVQRADGCWGGPDGYALVPTLSAVEALLTTLHRPVAPPGDRSTVSVAPPGDRSTVSVASPGDRSAVSDADGELRIAAAAGRGVRALADLGTTTMPDTPAADLLVPDLVGRINAHLDRTGRPRLPLPAGVGVDRLVRTRQQLASGAPVPDKLLHAAEAVAELVHRAPGVRPVPPGSVGASPAATAAWLGGAGPDADPEARSYLDAVARRHGGPVPCAVPITAFERAWVLSTLARAGVRLPAQPHMVRDLAAALGPGGTAAGPGLPADADTTAVTLYALALLGEPTDVGCLRPYRIGPHFCTWPGENGVSVTTNAHVLDAFGTHRGESDNHEVDHLAMWLCDQQNGDGSWIDRWHASLYYATSCCVLALDRFGHGGSVTRTVTRAVERAVEWVLATQRSDGSWGRWAGTTEETAYAMHVLRGIRREPDGRIVEAAARGRAYLQATIDRPGPALWHDKDLYRPAAIVRAAVIAALHLGRDTGRGPST